MKKIESDKRTTVLALSWRDIKAPKAGGAEVHTHEMLSRADKERYRIIHFSPKMGKLPEEEMIAGVTYLRGGSAITVIICAWIFYLENRKNIEFVIDQCNTHRFLRLSGSREVSVFSIFTR